MPHAGSDKHTGKSTIARAYKRTAPGYVHGIIEMTTAEIEIGDVATGSSGFGRNLYEPWSTIKKADGLRKGYLKLHILIGIGMRLIIDLEVTKSNVSDIRVFRKFLERFDWSRCRGGFMCADAAYPARDICTTIVCLGYVPRVMPKRNSTASAGGHPARRSMVLFYQNACKEFTKEYGQRNAVESVFGSIKQIYGNALRMRLAESREVEVMLDALRHNATYVCRRRFLRDGGPYPEQPGLQQYAARGLNSNRMIADAGPSIRDAVSEIIEGGVLRPAPDHDEDDILDAIRAIASRYGLPLFYPPGSSQYESAMKFAAPPRAAEECPTARVAAAPAAAAIAA